jgi:hypothetical protein
VELTRDMSALQAVRVREHAGHVLLHEGPMERTMKMQEVLLRAMARKITWFQAAEILVGPRSLTVPQKAATPSRTVLSSGSLSLRELDLALAWKWQPGYA